MKDLIIGLAAGVVAGALLIKTCKQNETDE